MSELRGIGLDICGIARMAQQLDNTHFLQRILTKEEIAYLRSRGASAADTLLYRCHCKRASCEL